MKPNSSKCIWTAVIAAVAVCMTMTTLAAPLPGAIFTTGFNGTACTGVDLNIYASKQDVYLNGGPSHAGALPDGSYYVQVTDPSGALLLGTSVGSGNPTPFVVSGGFANCFQVCSVLISGGNTDPNCGYDDTNNLGGEYKVWVSTDPTFPNNSTKTDNFKVRADAPPNPPTLCVRKFYDANVNGVKDPSECYINGWPFQVFADDNLYVQAETSWCGQVDDGSYRVVEDDIANWVHTGAVINGQPFTGPGSPSDVYPVTLPPDATVEFGNVCLGAGGGLTLGFWSNKNGQSLETASDFCFLNGLHLRNANGTDYDPIAGCPAPTSPQLSAAKTSLNGWLLSATATNMAYMLSAQLATMELNVLHQNNKYNNNTGVSGTALVYEECLKNYGYPTGFISINALMTAANAELGLHNVTTSGSPYRAYQECLKNALDDANNNRNFVQSQPCSPFTCAQ
jgi:hypothetical protein